MSKTKVDYTEVLVGFDSKGEQEDKQFHIKGVLSTTDPDMVNDIFTKNCVKSIVNQINGKEVKILTPKSLKVNFDHEHLIEHDLRLIPRGKINSANYIENNERASAVIDVVLNKHLPDYEVLKGSIEDKFLDSFSIEFKPLKFTTIQKEGKSYRLVDDVLVGGAAITGRPVNKHCSLLEFGLKSLALDLEDEEVEEEEEEVMEAKTDVAITAPVVQPTVVTTPVIDTKKDEEISILKREVEQLKAQMDLVKSIKDAVREEILKTQPTQKAVTDSAPTKFEDGKKEPYNVGAHLEKIYGVKR
jgi:hypothetical protein